MKVGILSDTHKISPDSEFTRQCILAFDGCDTIVHAGDLTDISILSVFRNKEVHAVCGNMCSHTTRKVLPEQKEFLIGGLRVGVTHGTGPRHNIEDRVLDTFPEAACIIFGHSHIPLCRQMGKTLLINPGSFQGTGRYGAPGSYATLVIEGGRMTAQIHFLAREL